ncbi:hypothetical protein F5887DRAFT_921559 [Amanita rubescens]|nr:hypothetical protein F5887DRAFT_925792 [Amanita rubescens]KAF8330935.1 hypothetical protein F5887DRAFT_922935 [Amanita rubescens]KAF8334369.1 hypothetical protein F5887DRAFT_921559 [Amanita rubescens]
MRLPHLRTPTPVQQPSSGIASNLHHRNGRHQSSCIRYASATLASAHQPPPSPLLFQSHAATALVTCQLACKTTSTTILALKATIVRHGKQLPPPQYRRCHFANLECLASNDLRVKAANTGEIPVA